MALRRLTGSYDAMKASAESISMLHVLVALVVAGSALGAYLLSARKELDRASRAVHTLSARVDSMADAQVRAEVARLCVTAPMPKPRVCGGSP